MLTAKAVSVTKDTTATAIMIILLILRFIISLLSVPLRSQSTFFRNVSPLFFFDLFMDDIDFFLIPFDTKRLYFVSYS